MTLALVKPYKQKHPEAVVIYQAAPGIANLLRPVMIEAGVDEVATTGDQVPHDKQYNLIGYPLAEGYPNKPMARHLLDYYAAELGLEGRHELRLKLPPRIMKQPYVTLHATAGWSAYKNWPLDRWAWVCSKLKERGIRVLQIGGERDQLVDGIDYWLGAPFEESLGLLANAQLHIGVDSWSNHATSINWSGKGKTPGVILWGSTQWSAAGYPHNTNISLDLPCQPCFREDPKISRMPRGVCINPPGQTYDKPRHACMYGIEQEYVLDAILKALEKKKPLAHGRVSPSATYSPWLADAEFQTTWKAIEQHTLIDELRCYELWQLAKQAERLPGAILEVGVWRGGTGCLLAAAAPRKIVYLADWYGGTVKTGANDSSYQDGEHADASIDMVKALLQQNKIGNAVLLDGVFPDKTGRAVRDDICLVHIDVDVYQSGRDVIDWALPRLVKGSIVVFDDYGFARCDGITKLVTELQTELPDFLFVHNLNGHAILVKTGDANERDEQVGFAPRERSDVHQALLQG